MISAGDERIILGFVETSEASMRERRIDGWRVSRTSEGWEFALLAKRGAPLGSEYAVGNGETVARAVLALIDATRGADTRGT